MINIVACIAVCVTVVDKSVEYKRIGACDLRNTYTVKKAVCCFRTQYVNKYNTTMVKKIKK